MQLKEIDKERYGKHYKQIMFMVVGVLAVVSLTVSTVLIQLVGGPEGENFWLNVAGVVVGAMVVAAGFRKYRHHDYMYEVVYVWDLKQMLNKIYRKQKAIKAAVTEGDREAMIIMNWSYAGSRQLYRLDNNTITMEELNKAASELEQTIADHGFDITAEDFDPQMLERF